jgi:Ser/Thr protein kinase RdoA (MazF antagonist)
MDWTENDMNTNFPVTYSIVSAKTLISDVLPDFGVGEIAACQFFTGGFNDTYRVKTMPGLTYYLRVYRTAWRSLPDILYELDVLNHLHRKGFSAIQPLPRHDGSLYFELDAPEGRRYAVLFTEAPGRLISYDHEPEKVAFQYGQAVACLHNAVEDFNSPHQRFHIDLDLLIDNPLRNIAPFLAHRPGDWDYLQDFAATLRRRIIELPVENLEQGFCHGDLQSEHANVAGDGTLTFFDFDCGGYGYRAYDLAVFRWCSRLEKQESVWWEPYLRGYRKTRPLNELDEQAIPLFVAARYIWHMGVHTQNANDWGCGWLHDGYFDQKLEYLRAVENDYFTGGGRLE